ncbi:uncharacterized protein BO95DRAFT_494973 [Aspergillus brunneoviolaceus CBS 621.78]|uniref:Uncharacterized protein n=1 Tax=Aspergillus brunneoviolaceus CBS 621.78 TaxID=1450534 RepID=A0ACD1GAQ4_9EURO|nr:hypothetical protein BO95DRAFT_494973 [Aspergillus brunneoviolaceus CBS 621.78]RAH46318.1 hypothetical protein BO95DRAFT_494973 [Aspergillus brunneoviolaceus CBS 621.78]
MKFHPYGTLCICTVLSDVSSAIDIPKAWTLVGTIGASVLTTKYGTPGNGVIVSAGLGTIHLIDTIRECVPAGKSGDTEDAMTCAESVVSAAVQFGMAVNNYQQVGYWTSKREQGGHEDFAYLDDYFRQLGDGVVISDVYYEGIPLNGTHLPQTVVRRGEEGEAAAVTIRALHNASMPLSFVYQNTRANHVPLLVATNGSHYHIGHLAPVGSSSSSFQRRGAIDTAFTHVGSGGVKVQCNSRGAVMTVEQAQVFLDSPSSGSSSSSAAMTLFLNLVNYATFAGFSFNEWVNGDLSGQWAMEAEVNGFGTNWETNWNWCFGVEQASCDKEL